MPDVIASTVPLVSILAPAKLNLMLHIVGRRDDGYHELQTLFQLLDYADQLDFYPAPITQTQLLDIHMSGPLARTQDLMNLPLQNNIVYRAAQALYQAGLVRGIAPDSMQKLVVHLHKKIPSGGGLGGGSANAAATLIALNQLWGLQFSTTELASIGLSLGADVPVFVHGRNAWAQGIGEDLTFVNLATQSFLVLHPGCQVATGRVFQHPNLTRSSPKITMRTALEQGGENACQALVCHLYPKVKLALDLLTQISLANQGCPARLTGTGACVFAAFAHQTQAQAGLSLLAKTLANSGLDEQACTYFVAQGKA
ncbi:4-diphosphocytidyl-2-C-methyl-D-erythritol kinase [Allopseudospirillum japonicum]|uniref:4-diphosphocytidyl-2-C-methyl-D-erythritol kinase n=1 Tax=Allopseudospirillum japonicum TaxID=64971 RepID=A0A1H6QEA7_9GAMM|nr:4-(cytidine 5'-diphospho)-2-C-methyl-D-erythritol kinase [Allopseudospirillum japonicum]SEI39274.1 4-diphosphocytidyl-2-C-methyl-D-erythritol kinase [Allopseudospirillum japonicum]